MRIFCPRENALYEKAQLRLVENTYSPVTMPLDNAIVCGAVEMNADETKIK
jgi:hypothetical protein